MRRFLPCVLTAVYLAVVSSASAQTEPPPDPLADWVDACYATKPDIQALLEHNALIISEDALTENPSGTWSLNVQPFTQYVRPAEPSPYVLDLCPQVRFYGQPQVIKIDAHASDVTRRSAVQVGPDLVLTTWHNLFAPSQPGWYKVVFGLHARNVGGECIPPDFENIPASQVYDVEAVVADGWPLDMLLLRLDRVVSDHYPRVRRSGRGWPGDAMTGIGHPQRLAAKVDRAAKAGPTTIEEDREWLGVKNVNLLPDSSGSMVYNRSQRILETVAKQGGGPTLEWLPAQGCLMFGHREGFTGLNASLRYFAEHIPAFELVVDSLDPVFHVVPLGGGIDPTHVRTVKAPLSAAGPIDYQIVPPAPPAPGQPSLSIVVGGPLTGTLAPGTQLDVLETASIHGASCGVHELSYEVRDLTNGFVDHARQVFEIGIREFTVAPLARWRIRDLAAPFEDETQYTVSNPRPTPVVVRATASQNWLKFNGVEPGSGDPPPSVDLLVEAYGSTVLTVGIAAWAESLPYTPPGGAPHQASVAFEVAPGDPCPTVGGTLTAEIQFEFGSESFNGPGGLPILSSSEGGTLVEVDVNETFCIDDVNLGVFTSGVLSDRIKARLTSPLEIRRLVWDRGILAPPGPLRGVLDDEGALHPFESLDVFDDTQGGGTWRFRVTDVGLSGGLQGSLDSWNLDLRARHCP